MSIYLHHIILGELLGDKPQAVNATQNRGVILLHTLQVQGRHLFEGILNHQSTLLRAGRPQAREL